MQNRLRLPIKYVTQVEVKAVVFNTTYDKRTLDLLSITNFALHFFLCNQTPLTETT